MSKRVTFNVVEPEKKFNINDEELSKDELDQKINPYNLVDKYNKKDVIETPKMLPQDDGKPKLVRVGRPLRHIQYKPVKEYVYTNNQIFPTGPSYDKIKLPLKPNTIIVNVKYFALNPIDIQIYNYYTSDLTGAQKGFGREFSGEVYEVFEGSDFNVGDKVCGIYYHLFNRGCSASHILIDLNKDPIVKVDDLSFSLFSYPKLCAWTYNFTTAFQILNSISTGGLNSESTVLINGGSTNTGMMTIQVLKNYFHVTNIVAICSGTASDLVVKCGASVIIDYKKEYDIVKALTSLLTNGRKTITDRHGNSVEVLYPDKKFDVIIDFIGGYKLLENQQVLLNAKNSTYLTTVGDHKVNYKDKEKFVYKASNNTWTTSMREKFGSKYYGVNYKMINYQLTSIKEFNNWLKIGMEMIKQGQMIVTINSTFKMNEINKALNKLKTQHALGKVIVENEDF